MRKNFLLTVCVLTFLGTTNAQANGELFPDLAKRNQDKTEQVKPDKDFKLFDNNVGLNLPEEKKPEEIFEEVEDIKLNKPAEEKKPAPAQKDEKKQTGFFEIYPRNVQIVTPPVDAESQFCKGTLVLENNSKHDLKLLKLQIQYGPAKINYTFGNIAAGTEGIGNIFMMGTACQGLKQTAQISVQECKATDLGDNECKQMVRYIIR